MGTAFRDRGAGALANRWRSPRSRPLATFRARVRRPSSGALRWSGAPPRPGRRRRRVWQTRPIGGEQPDEAREALLEIVAPQADVPLRPGARVPLTPASRRRRRSCEDVEEGIRRSSRAARHFASRATSRRSPAGPGLRPCGSSRGRARRWSGADSRTGVATRSMLDMVPVSSWNSTEARGRLRAGRSIIGLALFASATPTCLYGIYQAEWGFSTLVLTLVYAIYPLGARLASHGGADLRRPRPPAGARGVADRPDPCHRAVPLRRLGRLAVRRPRAPGPDHGRRARRGGRGAAGLPAQRRRPAGGPGQRRGQRGRHRRRRHRRRHAGAVRRRSACRPLRPSPRPRGRRAGGAPPRAGPALARSSAAAGPARPGRGAPALAAGAASWPRGRSAASTSPGPRSPASSWTPATAWPAARRSSPCACPPPCPNWRLVARAASRGRDRGPRAGGRNGPHRRLAVDRVRRVLLRRHRRHRSRVRRRLPRRPAPQRGRPRAPARRGHVRHVVAGSSPSRRSPRVSSSRCSASRARSASSR